MPENANSYETLVAVFRDELAIDPARVHPNALLIGELGFDSIAFAIGLVAIEERLGVTLQQEELILCKTVGDVVRLIELTRDRAIGFGAGISVESAIPA
ncbi:acyl carrier protein [Lysobacter antibioticus]|jgi:acyl carrier protein|uniref:Phosphopantetheine attachment site family protein n=1 Tax=Lysobacter antibioticus TaxID=84531 RepID=A0A0S2FCX1_LYSAN|nr:acyl carrier protein [Lysobacter antibioticus]ALN81386.1 phosphopantetheine attachment site family protein [Lysobacter antibioticus]